MHQQAQSLSSGTAREDEVLTASHTLSDADGLGIMNWQWSRDGVMPLMEPTVQPTAWYRQMLVLP